MSSTEFTSLSQEELRKRLYQTFKNKGVLDSLKTQLRNQLIRELRHPAFSGEATAQCDGGQADSLLYRASNSLVADHLSRCGYEYSLSVFYPECGLEKEQVFTVRDLLQLMKINPKSGLYKSLTSSLQNENAKVEKLQFIDEQFEEMYPKRHRTESLESKLSEYRKEMEEQLRAEMSQKLQHFKDVEVAKIKLEERDKSQKEMSDFRRELEKTYQTKSGGLVSREKNATERLQRQHEIEEKDMYAQRQTLLKDIEMVRSRETDLRHRIEAFEHAQKLQEDKNRSVDDSLRKRELEVRNIEDTFNQKLKNELLRHHIELKEEYLKRTHEVSEEEKRNKDEAARLREEAIVTNMKKQQIELALSRTKELEMEVDSLKAQLSLLTRQNHHLTDKLKETVDYPLIQEEKVELQTRVKLFKQQLEEIRNENNLLRERTTYPTPEFVALQAELRRVENARKLDQGEFKTHREILEKQLQNEVERCVEMKTQLSNCEDAARRLSAQIEQLELQLRQTQLALENEVYRNPKPSLVDRSVLDFTADKIVPPDIYVDKAVLKSQPLFDSFVGAGGVSDPRYRQPTGTRSSSPDSDLEFVANSKIRIKELEKEAEFLEEAYRNYQHRVIHAVTTKSNPQAHVPPSSLPRGLLTTVSAALPHKVTFAEDNLTTHQQILVTRLKTQKYGEIMSAEEDSVADTTPLRTKVSSARRLSSTPISKADPDLRNRENVFLADKDGSYISSSPHSPNHRISPIPKIGKLSAHICDVPDLPLEADNEQLSSLRLTSADCHELTDHSKPQKLNFEDLNHSDSSLQDQEDIPEQLESDGSHLSRGLVHSNHVTATVPVAVTSQQDSLSSTRPPVTHKPKKDEEESKHRDTRENFEERQREFEIEEKEKHPQKSLMAEPDEAEEQKAVEDSLGVHDPEEASASAKASVNPLDKYMKMILQNRAEEQSQKITKDSLEEFSVEEKLSNESITALSHGEADEDFW
ncbi:hypothetical protein FKM82_008868 [Ascaphus truei]